MSAEPSGPLYACSKCWTRHPFEELSSGLQLCKACRAANPIIKCKYCRTEFQQAQKRQRLSICPKCEGNEKNYGPPKACAYCNIKAAFIGSKCQRCTNSETKYGPPVVCEQCRLKCAFHRKDKEEEVKKLDGKTLCWLCTISYKRALAKSELKEKNSSGNHKDKHHRPHSHHHKHREEHVSGEKRKHHAMASSGLNQAGPMIVPPPPIFDREASDHLVTITLLTEKVATLEKRYQQKENELLAKEKFITELRAMHFTKEEETRNQMITKKKEYEREVEGLHMKVKAMQREIGSLTKRLKMESANNNAQNQNSVKETTKDSVFPNNATFVVTNSGKASKGSSNSNSSTSSSSSSSGGNSSHEDDNNSD